MRSMIWAASGGLALVGLAFLTSAASAAACGDGRACRCGDTVTVSYALPSDLGPCSGHGLILKSGASLDCRGLHVTGLGDGSDQYGIFLNGKPGAEVAGATVKNCHVSRFMRGIRLRAARGNQIVGNHAVDNGNHSTHVGYGIDVSGASSDNVFEGNEVQGNADEGMHIGYGGHKNRLVGNLIHDNYRENLYLLGADGGTFLRNTLGGGGVNSLYVKDSSGNRFEGNTIRDKTVHVVGNAHDNEFVGNTFAKAGIHFAEYKANPPRSPSKNHVTGGSITGATNCVRFTSARGNVVTDTALADCETSVRSESPTGPSDNTFIGKSPAKVRLDEGSTLQLGFSLGVQVRDPSGAPVREAKVEAKDASGVAVFSVVTDEAGHIPAQIVIGAAQTGTRVTTNTPFTVTVTKSGYPPAVAKVTEIAPTTLTISLDAR
jgi:parallel beta-helix repeat protein